MSQVERQMVIALYNVFRVLDDGLVGFLFTMCLNHSSFILRPFTFMFFPRFFVYLGCFDD
jgi:hypothetical protein